MDKNPCSVPRALRLLIPVETSAQQAVCAAHDVAYERGGTETERALADGELFLGMLRSSMPPYLAEEYFWAVRRFGIFFWGQNLKSEEPIVGK